MLPGPLMLPPRMLALSRQRLEARMEARMLCLLPRRTAIKDRVLTLDSSANNLVNVFLCYNSIIHGYSVTLVVAHLRLVDVFFQGTIYQESWQS